MNPSSTLGHVRRGHIHRGFTLIELLVVIAIIGILSSVVLASLNTARQKGTDAKIQTQLRSVAVNAEIWYDSNGSKYGVAANCDAGMFTQTTPNIDVVVNDLQAIAGTASCVSSDVAFAVWHTLVSTTSAFCVDSTGRSLITNDNTGGSPTLTTSSVACPSTY